jgi:hypothetical protein
MLARQRFLLLSRPPAAEKRSALVAVIFGEASGLRRFTLLAVIYDEFAGVG